MSNDIKDLFKATAYDNSGDKLGSVKEIFVDDKSGQPTFVEVNHGLFGMNSSLVPMRGHKFDGENLNLAFAKDRVKDAPDFDADQALTPEQQNEIYRHYGLDNVEDTTRYGEGAGNQHAGVRDAGEERSTLDRHEAAGGNTAAGAGVGAAGAGVGAAAGAGVAGANADQAGVTEREAANTDAANREAAVNNEGEIIRSEERLNVQKDKVQTGEARLRKYVVTDTETVEVPVTREEVRVERTPISEEEAANLKGNIDEAGQEASVTLSEERVSVNKETVPVEKVSLNKEQITETERHTEEVRKEQIDSNIDGDVRK
ncbi:DUF2382 domain-containing protein [Corynebacterium jeikeium]|uniref:PRC and DUF2382 domain-containing protein n=1 Tax=Corynebacterium jeikeium TaxID=38289 RepID=UPI0001B7187D|nr:PRC and DUF2382 domain-containing protein [Corynebacterium jeikeium]EEW15968.1 hypothetical protein HMPREF0297_1664 [Corynebacterium jeikeium ATCC 43734]OOD31532.1 photosystem reaction center subunit H [Corynebacterium jeikeium]WCZ54411.1 Stress response protein YsnF [Corynebacterium jeikeium]SUY80284.1 Uncharacterized protein conserved in bacteria [Corynebacterium jeikeium]